MDDGYHIQAYVMCVSNSCKPADRVSYGRYHSEEYPTSVTSANVSERNEYFINGSKMLCRHRESKDMKILKLFFLRMYNNNMAALWFVVRTNRQL